MDYMTAEDTGLKWGISSRRVQILCNENRVPGAMLFGGRWFIPYSATKPESKKPGPKSKINKPQK